MIEQAVSRTSSAVRTPIDPSFDRWVAATSAPEDLVLGLPDFAYPDLYLPAKLAALTAAFHHFLGQRDVSAFNALKDLEAHAGAMPDPIATSNALIAVAPHLSAFLASLFGVEQAWDEQKRSIKQSDPVWLFRHEFTKKRVFKPDAGKGWDEADAELVAHLALVAADARHELLGTGSEEEELEIARATMRLFEVDDTARKLAKAGGAVWQPAFERLADDVRVALETNERAHALFEGSPQVQNHLQAGAITTFALSAIEADLAFRRKDHGDRAHTWPSLREPNKLNYQALVQLRRPDPDMPELFVGPETHRRERAGFALTDKRATRRQVQAEVDYCLYCHDRDKDSCSKGLRVAATGAIKPNPLGVALEGCPLDEKISEMHFVRRRDGDALAALALLMIDNPMCPGTGHRICNDCMKGCIFQKQEPVNIPQVETATLTDVLSLPWGFEIYGLLTRWNPLNVKWPHLAPLNGKSALVVGLGPAGYTLAHHLARAGFAVAGVDGLKIEPLPLELTGDETHTPRPIKRYADLDRALDERIVLGFGGVSEYGITVRWDKNFLSVLYITIARNRRVRIYGGVRFGGTITLDDAWRLGFDHVALAAGAGKPTIIDMKNNLARGIRKASDFLMALQLSGAYKRSSLANLQVQLPAVVIGGGLTAIDTATELLAYYVIQAEKTSERFRTIVRESGEGAVRERFDSAELAFLHEQCAHADAIAAERKLAAAEGREPKLQALLDSWGGVTIAYRKGVLDSPAYRLNHEEVEKSLEEGVRYLENLSPTEAVLDQTGAVKAIKLERQLQENGKWRATGEIVELPARTLCIAAGTSPNTTFEKEYRGVFKLDARDQYFQPHVAKRGDDGTVTTEPSLDARHAFFTSYASGHRTVSFYGDNHPYYAGSVVKAMASAKVGFEKVAELYADREQPSAQERAARRERIFELFRRLDSELLATVHEVVRLTPTIIEIIVKAPAAARNFQPGQFYRLQNFETRSPIAGGTRLAMEGIALTGAWVDKEQGLLSTIVLEMGVSSRLCAMLKPGDPVVLMGPTGTPTEIPSGETVLLCGGGLGNAVLFSIARAMKERGDKVIYFAGYRLGEDMFRQADIEVSTDQVIWCTDSGAEITARRGQDRHFRGNVVQAMIAFAKGELGEQVASLKGVKRIIAIGSDRMMHAVQLARHGELAPYLDPKHIGIGSINSPMQCMMKEICAQCLQKHRDPETGREFVVFSCTNQDQELDRVDWEHLNQRLRANSAQEKLSGLWLTRLLDAEKGLLRV